MKLPTKFQVPSSKFQTPKKLQNPSDKHQRPVGRHVVWSLRLGVSLELGAWSLEFGDLFCG
jgi:hypothetical protein